MLEQGATGQPKGCEHVEVETLWQYDGQKNRTAFWACPNCRTRFYPATTLSAGQREAARRLGDVCQRCGYGPLGEDRDEEWYRCPNCDTRPSDASYIARLEQSITAIQLNVGTLLDYADPVAIRMAADELPSTASPRAQHLRGIATRIAALEADQKMPLAELAVYLYYKQTRMGNEGIGRAVYTMDDGGQVIVLSPEFVTDDYEDETDGVA